MSEAQKPKSKTARNLAIGAAAAAVISYAAYRLTTAYEPPVGWVGSTDATLYPCPAQPPGPHPYLIYVNPKNGGHYYLRADGAVRPATNQADGHFSGEGLSTHTLLYILRDLLFPDWNAMEIPIRTGVTGADGKPLYVFTAPWRNATVEGHPDQTICDKWRQQNKLPDSAVCPSNLTMLAYSQAIDNFQDWTAGNAARAAEIAHWCNRTPTPGAPSPTPPIATLTPIPTAPPVCPTCAAVVTCQPTTTKTSTLTSTKINTRTLCPPCTPTPTSSAGIDPGLVAQDRQHGHTVFVRVLLPERRPRP